MYYWIIKYKHQLKPEIFQGAGDLSFFKSIIGPYFSYKEAMAVLYTWTR